MRRGAPRGTEEERMRAPSFSAAIEFAIIASAAIAFAIVLSTAVRAEGAEPIRESVRADPKGQVSVDNTVGSVKVTGWNRSEVQIVGTLGAEAERLAINTEEDEVDIEVVLPHRVQSVEDTNLEIRVPEGCELQIRTVSATVDVEGITGSVNVETVSGDVAVRGDAESVEVESVSGAIELSGARGKAEAKTVSGRILIEGGRKVEASTTSGSIEIAGDVFREVQATSVSGSITFDGVPDRDGEFDFENFSGAIELYLPSDVEGEFEIETFSGRIQSDLGGTPRTPKHGPGASMSVRLGRSEAQFTINTFSGSIHLKTR
jgi:DUF4097 and DUF4098 domain-containing protein YvlB